MVWDYKPVVVDVDSDYRGLQRKLNEKIQALSNVIARLQKQLNLTQSTLIWKL